MRHVQLIAISGGLLIILSSPSVPPERTRPLLDTFADYLLTVQGQSAPLYSYPSGVP